MHIQRTRLLLLAAIVANACLVAAQSTAPQPTTIPGAESKVYKTIGDTALMLHIFYPAQHTAGARLPAIIFFFGGGWNSGTVNQFVPHSKYLAERGMIAVVADYRVRSRHGVTPIECVEDAMSAMRWLRTHASALGIDEHRIAASGGSAGGHLAACTALLTGFDAPNENAAISAIPNALVLFNPVLDMPEMMEQRSGQQDQRNDWRKRAIDISPIHHMQPNAPPTIIFHGTADSTVPFSQVIRFCAAMKQAANPCEVVSYEGRPHGFFNYRNGENPDYYTTLRKADEFLISIGYLKGAPTLR